MSDTMLNKGKDLTKEAPRSAHDHIGGFAILGRTIDKCRAQLWGNIGEYHFDCPVDNMLFKWKGLKGDDFKRFVSTGATDEEIADWVRSSGTKKSDADIQAWNEEVESDDYSKRPADKKKWLEGENARLGIDKDTALFDMLDADDKASFMGKAAATQGAVCEI